jgi:hypothetical protein
MFGQARWSVAVAALLLGALGLTLPARAQEAAGDTGEKVRFVTVDGVTIHGNFFRGPRAAPAVVMLHPIGAGESRNKKNWIALAQELQKDFSVLTFDFRGHGDSTEIDAPLYYHYKFNGVATKNARVDRARIEFKDILPQYYSVFCNDIAAAKSYLERTKNDLGLCNTQNFVVIGADQGATLGAVWANSEWFRYRMEIATGLLGVPQLRFDSRPEGKWISAYVFLTISPKLGNQNVSMTSLLNIPSKLNMVPSVFLFSEPDKKAKDTAKALEKDIKFGGGKKADPRFALTAAVGVKSKDKLNGIDLLQPSLKTSEQIHEWLKLTTQTNNEWAQRDFTKTLYAWKGVSGVTPARVIPPSLAVQIGIATPDWPPNVQVPDAVEKNILFNSYQGYVR